MDRQRLERGLLRTVRNLVPRALVVVLCLAPAFVEPIWFRLRPRSHVLGMYYSAIETLEDRSTLAAVSQSEWELQAVDPWGRHFRAVSTRDPELAAGTYRDGRLYKFEFQAELIYSTGPDGIDDGGLYDDVVVVPLEEGGAGLIPSGSGRWFHLETLMYERASKTLGLFVVWLFALSGVCRITPRSRRVPALANVSLCVVASCSLVFCLDSMWIWGSWSPAGLLGMWVEACGLGPSVPSFGIHTSLVIFAVLSTCLLRQHFRCPTGGSANGSLSSMGLAPRAP
jgi:hypothetical protein